MVQARSSAEGEDGKTGIGGKVKEEMKYLGKVNRVGKYMIVGPIEFLDDEFTVKPSSSFCSRVQQFGYRHGINRQLDLTRVVVYQTGMI